MVKYLQHMSVHRGYKYTAQQGFALPTGLITSVVMMIVLLAALNSISSISVSIQNQYYSKLAQLAAESGAAVARACIQASPDGRAQWGKHAISPDRNFDGEPARILPSKFLSGEMACLPQTEIVMEVYERVLHQIMYSILHK